MLFRSLTAIIMHSATEAALKKQDLIEYIPASTNGTDRIPTFLGKRVIVDDGVPFDTGMGVCVTYLFGPGAIAYGEGNPVGFVPTETDRDSLAGEDYLVNRRTFILHPRGVRFTSANVVGVAPSNTELADGDNWTRVFEPKAIRIVKFVHKIA